MKVLALASNGTTNEVRLADDVVTLTWQAVLSIASLDLKHVKVILAGATTLTIDSGVDGQRILLELIQDATGSRTLAFGGSNIVFGTDFTSITLTTTPSKTDYIGLVYNASSAKWRVVAFARGY